MVDTFECNLGAAIEHAAGLLPLGYEIVLSIENGEYGLLLLPPEGDSIITKCKTLIDGIEDLVAKAVFSERDKVN